MAQQRLNYESLRRAWPVGVLAARKRTHIASA
jgi:hypothetical protein